MFSHKSYPGPTKTISLLGWLGCLALALAQMTWTSSAGEDAPRPRQDLLAAYERGKELKAKPVEDLIKDGIGQTELLVFQDTETKAEMWRLSWDPQRTFIHMHINRTPWSSDGSVLMFQSVRPFTVTPDEKARFPIDMQGRKLFLMHADGSRFRLLKPYGAGADCQMLIHNTHNATWDRTRPNVLYFVDNKAAYELDVKQPACKDELAKICDLPNPERRKWFFAQPSPDNHLMALDAVKKDSAFKPEIYIIARSGPEAQSKPVLHYPLAFEVRYEFHDLKTEYGFHDVNFRRNAENTYVFNFGSTTSVGEGIFFEAPLDGEKSKVKFCYDGKNPHTPYYSHPAWGPGGKLVAYFGVQSGGGREENPGLNVREHDARKPVARLIEGWVGGHIAWDGNDPDWLYAAVSSAQFAPKWDGKIVYCKTDGTDSRILCTHGSRADRDDYGTNPRPAQSPDGTKCLFSSNLLHDDAKLYDLYVVVGRRPYPPKDVRLAAGATAGVKIAWTPPALGSEIAGYHVYRCAQGGPWAEVTAELVTQPCFSDTAAKLEGKYVYAVTSEEYSGLESEMLSNALEIEVSNTGIRAQASEKGGVKGWDQTPPAAPSGFSAAKVRDGVVHLKWDKPSPPSDVRFYQVYFSTEQRPPTTRLARIATIPAAVAGAWSDWGVPAGKQAHYALTAVDRQGNESAPACSDLQP